MAAPITLGGDVAASGVAALGSLANSFLGNIMGRSNMSKQIQASKELMKYEWNNFKSPAAQANALAAAGFNPTALFGSSGGSIATPSPVMPTAATFQQPSVGDISSFVLAMAQAKKAQADAKKAGVDTRLAEVETEAKQYELDLNKVFRSPERIAQLTLAWKNVRLSDDEHNIKVWTETKEKALAGLSEAQRDTALKVLDNMDIQLEQENKQREESIKLTQAEQKTEGTKQTANLAAATASKSAASLSDSQKEAQDLSNEIRKASKRHEIRANIHKFKSEKIISDAQASQAENMLNMYEHLLENNENAAAEYLNYFWWYLKNEMPNVPIVPMFKVGKK